MKPARAPLVDIGSCWALGANLQAAARILSAVAEPRFVPGVATYGPDTTTADKSDADAGQLIRSGALALRGLGLAVKRFAMEVRAIEHHSAPVDLPADCLNAEGSDALAVQTLRRAQRRLRASARSIASDLAASTAAGLDGRVHDTKRAVVPPPVAQPTTVFPCGSPTPSSTPHRSTTCSTC